MNELEIIYEVKYQNSDYWVIVSQYRGYNTFYYQFLHL